MPGHRQSDFMVDKTIHDVEQLALRGYTQVQISEKLKIPKNTIGAYITELRTKWCGDGVRDRSELVGRTLNEIESLKREAWEAWLRSCQKKEYKHYEYHYDDADWKDFKSAFMAPKDIVQIRRRFPHMAARAHDETGEPDKRFKVKITERTEEQLGDPRYLQIVSWCIERTCKLLGLDAPTKITADITLWEAAKIVAAEEGLDPAEMVTQAESVLAKHRALQSG